MPLPTNVVDLIEALNLIPHPEGGFFIETYRSGVKPMVTMGSTGIQNCVKPEHNLINTTDGRINNRKDEDERRNTLTSIFWVPTLKSCELNVGVNCSDHVHYYHGGLPFQYYIFNPDTKESTQVVLGPELQNGHQLQVCVPGGVWKCGCILVEEQGADNGDNEQSMNDYDYSLIGEAVAPGFDFHDFSFIKEDEVRDKCSDDSAIFNIFLKYLHETARNESKNRSFDFQEYYDEKKTQKRRVDERS